VLCEYEDIIVLWTGGVQIGNKKDKICLLIDLAVASDRIVTEREVEKELKYKNLST
jgi:hypothetical protein